MCVRQASSHHKQRRVSKIVVGLPLLLPLLRALLFELDQHVCHDPTTFGRPLVSVVDGVVQALVAGYAKHFFKGLELSSERYGVVVKQPHFVFVPRHGGIQIAPLGFVRRHLFDEQLFHPFHVHMPVLHGVGELRTTQHEFQNERGTRVAAACGLTKAATASSRFG